MSSDIPLIFACLFVFPQCVVGQSMMEPPCRWPGVPAEMECRGIHEFRLPREPEGADAKRYTPVPVPIPADAVIERVEVYVRNACGDRDNANLNESGYCRTYFPCEISPAEVTNRVAVSASGRCEVQWATALSGYERVSQGTDVDILQVWFRSTRYDNTRRAAVRVLFTRK